MRRLTPVPRPEEGEEVVEEWREAWIRLEAVRMVSCRCVGRHLKHAVGRTPSFVGLDGDAVVDLLTSDELDVRREEDAYDAACVWARHNDDSRPAIDGIMARGIRWDHLTDVQFLVKVE